MSETTETVTVEFENGRRLVAPSFEANPHGAHFLEAFDEAGKLVVRTNFEQLETDPEGEIDRLAAALCTDERYSSDYDVERYAISKKTGATLCFDARCGSYVRICDPDEQELVYWIFDEWAEDPELVLGALVGCLLGGAEL